ncbi:PH domain-containing protein [Kineococcus rhizosphaerae]|uniref:Putative membrane protein n=1 Tax=Kineococcus rhizosphaerae TaxID=559628 RepID=A0A2T0R5I8_9ACTN|nr:PH domain-containing protein [Kineococcus rhizosphaerae]PRY16031.1 putative membrane protein [Kineococcus rhizosphaerae]
MSEEPAVEAVPDEVAVRLDAPTRAVLADPGWRKLHPVTPVLRAWKVVAAVVAVVVGQNVDDILRLELPGWVLTLSVLGGLLALALVGAVYSALAWRRMRYRIDAEAVHVERGILWRQQRRAQLDRLQAVDVVRPLLGRLFGLAELRLEVAGGSGSRVSLAYLKEEEAQRVRNALLAASAGVVVAEGEDAPEAPEREVVQVPATRLIVSTLRSGLTIWVVLAVVGIGVGCWFAKSFAPLFGSAAAVLGGVSAVWQRFNTGFNFTVGDSPDGLRMTHGLLEQRAQTVPPGRVQALRITQPLLWRGKGWWKVEVNVAGYSGESGKGAEQSTTLLPVGTVDELGHVLAIVLPDLGTSEASPLDVVRAGLTGSGTDGGFTPVPRQARWLDWISWRRRGYLVTDHAFLSRNGRVVRGLDVVPHARTQSLGLTQGPWQRRLGLASVRLHSTPGKVSPRVDHLDEHVAALLLREQTARARAARAGSGPERWMTGR